MQLVRFQAAEIISKEGQQVTHSLSVSSWERNPSCSIQNASFYSSGCPNLFSSFSQMSSRYTPELLPVAPVKTSPWDGLSEIIAVASTVDVRSNVRAPEVVICPEGVTVTGNIRSTFIINTQRGALGCLAVDTPVLNHLTSENSQISKWPLIIQVWIMPMTNTIGNGNKSPIWLPKALLPSCRPLFILWVYEARMFTYNILPPKSPPFQLLYEQ